MKIPVSRCLIEPMPQQVRNRIGTYIFNENKERLTQVVKRLLQEQGKNYSSRKYG